jgi:hypothetical protein
MTSRFALMETLTLIGLSMVIGASTAMAMKIEIDKGNYACAGDSATATVTDNSLPLPASISVALEAFDGGAVLIDTETLTNFVQIPDPVDQIFESGPLTISDAGVRASENGVLDVTAGGTVVATYVSGGTHTDTATTCAAPPAASSISTAGAITLVLLLASTFLILGRVARQQDSDPRPS